MNSFSAAVQALTEPGCVSENAIASAAGQVVDSVGCTCSESDPASCVEDLPLEFIALVVKEVNFIAHLGH